MIIDTVKTILIQSHFMIPQHQTYETIIKLVNTKKLKEPFYPIDIATAAGKKDDRALREFPAKHKKGNPKGRDVLFTKLKDNSYKLVRPLKYGLK